MFNFNNFNLQKAKFIWDDKKEEQNFIKHGIKFKTATKIFADKNIVCLKDFEHSKNEERYKLIGKVRRIMVVITTIQEDEFIRIISARFATRKERLIYVNSYSKR